MFHRLRQIVIRLIASRLLSNILSILGALFLTKELLHTVIDRFWETVAKFFNIGGPAPFHVAFVGQLLVDCLFFVFFFLIAFVVFRFTHADDYLRRLLLLVIKAPENYLVFLQEFICDRIEAIDKYNSYKRLFEEIEMLLVAGKERFSLHHKRSVCFLLGLNYPVFKNTIEHMESGEINMNQARKSLEEAVLTPLRCVTEPSFRYAGTSKKEHLIRILQIAAEPSYDKAIEMFCRELKQPIASLKAHAEKKLDEAEYNGIIAESHQVLSFFEARCKARMGFPVYDFIDQRSQNQLSKAIARVRLGTLQHQAQELLGEVVDCLKQFTDCQDKSRNELIIKLRKPTAIVPRLDTNNNVICLYGYSSMVKLFIESCIPNEDRPKVGFLLIKTDNLATTPFEERRMRDELLEMGFVDVSVHSFQDLLLFEKLPRPLVFCLGFEVINSKEKKAVFHFGAGQLLHRLIWSLSAKDNQVRVLLIGAKYKDIDFKITAPQVAHASTFDYGDYERLNNVSVAVLTG